MKIYRLEVVTDEIVAAFQRLFPQLTDIPAPTCDELEQMAAADYCIIFMASVDGQIAGTATLGCYRTPTGLHTWIEDVVVDQIFRRQGVGEALTLKLIETAREMNAHSLCLTSRPSREAANRLYQQLGFIRWDTNLYRFPL